MIYVLTGNGKGKTTSGIGMGIRAVGAGKKVLMVQFLKTKSLTSESAVIEKIKNFEIESFGREGFFLPQRELKKNPELKKMGVKALSKKDFQLAKRGFNLIKKAAESKKYQLLILDEICIAIYFGLIDKKDILSFLKKISKKAYPGNAEEFDIVLTGRYCPKEIIKIADLVTEMKEIRHYYQRKIEAREGIEY